MSRSRPKHAIAGITTAASEKADKRHANRALRKATRQTLGTVSDETVFPVVREVSDTWSMAKDGKQFFDPASNRKLMRK